MRMLHRILAISAVTFLGAVSGFSAGAPLDTSGPMVPTSVLTAEGSCFAKGSFVAQGDLGLLARRDRSVFYGILGGAVNADYGVHDLISVGLGLGFTVTRSMLGVTYHRYFEIPIGVRAGFHPFNFRKIQEKIKIADKLDAYVGFATGVGFAPAIWHDPTTTFQEVNDPTYNFFYFVRPLVGARYYFIPNKLFGTFELGGVCGWFNFGAGMKF